MMTSVEQARQSFGSVAGRMLSGSVTFIEGAREIVKLSFAARLDGDADIRPFVGVDSETDALPIDSRIRALWAPSALENLGPEIDAAQAWAQKTLKLHCERLVERFGSAARL